MQDPATVEPDHPSPAPSEDLIAEELGSVGAPPPTGGSQVSGAAAGSVLILLLAGLIVVGAFGYGYLLRLHVIPVAWQEWVLLGVIFGLGAVAIHAFGVLVRAVARRWSDPRRGSLIYSFYRVIAYVLLTVVVLSFLGANTVALLAGGTFAGLVVGLAGQTVLSNVIAGVFLLFVAPFSPGDRITMVSWQYGLLAPTYPPKFFSQDTLIPGYTGTVSDIGITYTAIRLDEGTMFKVPNNVVVQAAVISHETRERWVRLKYEVPPSIPPEVLLPKLSQAIRRSRWIAVPGSVNVLVNQATMNSYVVSVDAICHGNAEEPPRSALLQVTMRIVRELQHPPK